MKSVDQTLKRYEIESEQKWREEIEHIPYIQFPPEWKVRVIPPFGDAVVRFQVVLPSGARRSVYLDSRHSLGYYGSPSAAPVPYWEVYPHRGDIARCHRDNVGELLELIADEAIGEADD